MFTQLAVALAPLYGNDAAQSANAVLTAYRPSQLSEYLETLWGTGRDAQRQAALGPALNAANHQNMARLDLIDPLAAPPAVAIDPPPAPAPVVWPHLAYAYMLENTRMVDIFRRVVFEYTHGERLPTASQATQRWLHATEQLFFRDAWSYSVRAVTSSIRPDSASVRRNAYYRILGMDLNHGSEDGRAYPYYKPPAANRDFPGLFEALLTEVWRGYANRVNLIGENATDDDAILTLLRRLQEMLTTRRVAGALSREEFDTVAMLSWFHLTVQYETQIVADLDAQGGGVADHLKKIGERVGLSAHARSDAYFHLAVPLSNVLLAIESGTVGAPGNLYTPAGPHTGDMLQVITHWSIATGRNMKDPTLRQPLGAVLGVTGSGAPGGNGSQGSRLTMAVR